MAPRAKRSSLSTVGPVASSLQGMFGNGPSAKSRLVSWRSGFWQSGPDLLVLSSSQFDPSVTSNDGGLVGNDTVEVAHRESLLPLADCGD